MGQAEIRIFIFLIAIVIAVFITGLILLVFQYRRRKLIHLGEKMAIEKQHRLDLLNNQLLTQRETMKFIGAEIHDSVTQKLSLASIYTQKIEYENRNPDIRDSLLGVSGIINDALAELRDLSHTLTSDHMQQMGFVALLREEQERINSTGICRMEITTNLRSPIGFTTRSALLRIVQEFVQNSLKHARCKHITLTLDEKADGLGVVLADDGCGFDMRHIGSGGIGLGNMRRRISGLRGSFELHSIPDAGTELKLFVPHQTT